MKAEKIDCDKLMIFIKLNVEIKYKWVLQLCYSKGLGTTEESEQIYKILKYIQ